MNPGQLKLCYHAPAANWLEALPLGNGRIGAMVFSNPSDDLFSLNEDTLWSGYPKDTNVHGAKDFYPHAVELAKARKYREAQEWIEDHMLGPFTESYLPLGDFRLKFPGLMDKPVSSFYRELTLTDGVSRSRFTCDGVTYHKEAFISAPHQAMVVRLTADKPGMVSLKASFDSQLHHTVSAKGNRLILEGLCPSHVDPNYVNSPDPIIYEEDDAKKGISFCGIAAFELDGGTVQGEDSILSVKDANAVTIRFCVRTSFNGYQHQPYINGRPYRDLCEADCKAVASVPYPALLEAHIADHSALFSRVDFSLGNDPMCDVPTDQRLRRFAQTQDDPGLYPLIFQYGRYLLIASSRPGTQAANLQGIWNKELRAPWSSNYTVNINTEMNYWPAEICNLSELHEPLFRLVEMLGDTGKRTAEIHYGAKGFTAHHNVDIWGLSNPVGNKQRGTAGYAFWPMSAGWLSRHLFEHYEFTMDQAFLEKTAYPLIKGAAEFYLDLLTEDPDGHLILCPSTSPENAFLLDGKPCNVAMTVTMTMAIVRETLEHVEKCCEILDCDKDFAEKVHKTLERLLPYQVGSRGQLLEWNEEFVESEPQHRHTSHLYGLHPGHQITPYTTPELAGACRETLIGRGDDGTGWCLGWRINFWARLQDGDHALKLLKRQLRLVESTGTNYRTGGGTYPNLFDAHPPFQIDGNFGASAGIAEMFLQSYEGALYLLPALPGEFQNGYINGLKAREGLEADISFANGKLDRVALRAVEQPSRPLTAVYQGKSLTFSMNKGDSKTLTLRDFEI